VAGRRTPLGNLPADLTTFVGRGKESSQVRLLLSRSRLVTLTGVGGVGKSRLALRAARQLSRTFPDGTWLVELSSLQDPALVPQAVGQALGLADQGTGDPVQALCDALASRRLLIVVDNCEHLVPACQQLLTALLRGASGLRVLATSREVLWIPGEQVYDVAPLQVPQPSEQRDLEAMAGYPGVALFASRAGEIRPGFAVTADNADAVARVCGLSEGLPLFLELAAAQLRSLSVQQLAARLDDRFQLLTTRSAAVPARHQSLRAAVAGSFMLCSEAERLVWVRASVFAGRFDLEAAEAVCAGETLSAGDVLDALAGLIDKSVVVSAERDGQLRYWMLDTLRAYGLEQLRASPAGDGAAAEEQPRRQHRDYHLELAERFDADWFGPRQVQWSRRMRAELPEMRSALAFCLATPGEAPAATRLARALGFFWYACGATREGRLWLQRVLAAEPSPPKDRARALVVYARVLISSGLHAEAAEPARECLELARRFGDPALLVQALSICGVRLVYAGDVAAGLPLLDEAVGLAEGLPDAGFVLATMTLSRSFAAIAVGDPVRADALAAQCRAVCRAHGDRWLLNRALIWSIPPALILGDAAGAAGYGRESLSISAALGDTPGLALSLEFLARTAAAGGDHRRAARLLGAADVQDGVNGGTPASTGPLAAGHDQCEAAARAALGDVRFDDEFRSGAELTLEEVIVYAQGDPAQPARAWAAPPSDGRSPLLTKRELEVARLVAEGLTNKQIAHQLVIAQRTAESHVEHILSKLGLTTRTQIASWMHTRQSSGGAPTLRPGEG
jgi:predicted ATPase/DNA-binding CsgD family transcriptional regulator